MNPDEKMFGLPQKVLAPQKYSTYLFSCAVGHDEVTWGAATLKGTCWLCGDESMPTNLNGPIFL